jgi:hypothetical protein
LEVVLISNSELKDFSRFAPEYAAKGRVMPFVAHVPEEIYNTDSTTVLKKYNLPENGTSL